MRPVGVMQVSRGIEWTGWSGLERGKRQSVIDGWIEDGVSQKGKRSGPYTCRGCLTRVTPVQGGHPMSSVSSVQGSCSDLPGACLRSTQSRGRRGREASAWMPVVLLLLFSIALPGLLFLSCLPSDHGVIASV